MPGAIATLPRLKFTDLSGGPLASGTLTTYLSGSTTKTPTWQDQALTILNTNPIVLDANGSCIVWLDNTKAYKIVLADKNGVVQWTQSNVVGGGVDTSVVLNAALIQSAVDASAASASASEASRQAVDSRFYPGIYAVAPTTRPNGSARQEGDQYSSITQSYIFRSGEWVNYEATAVAKALEATTGANTATTQAGISTTQAGLAAAAKVQAEAARDSLNTTGKVFTAVEGTAAGIAATIDGQQFAVLSADLKFYTIYRNNAGAALSLSSVYTKAYHDGMIFVSARGSTAFAIVDSARRTAVRIMKDGEVRIGKLVAKLIDAATASITLLETSQINFKGQSESLKASIASGRAFAIADNLRRVAFQIYKTGLVSMGAFKAKTGQVDTLTAGALAATSLTVNGLPVTGGAAAVQAAFPQLTYSYAHIFSYGQSLSVGERSIPLQSTSQPYDSLMFAGGVRALGSTSDPAVAYASFVPMVESTANEGNVLYSISTPGETPLSGQCRAIKQLLASEDKVLHTTSFHKLIGTATGRGSSALAALVKGTAPYTRFMDEVTRAKALALVDNRSYGVTCVTWMQGESDGGNTTTYKAAEQALFADLNTDIKAITGQAEDVQFLTYQTPVAFTVGLQQLAASEETANIHLATPIYQLTFYDTIAHLDGLGSLIAGAYLGKVYKRVVIDKKAWKPLSPLSISRLGKALYVKMNVPYGHIELDTTLMAAQENYGFVVTDGGGTVVAPTNITIEGADTVRFLMPSTVTAGYKVEYAKTLSGGNLRDSDGDLIKFDPAGVNYPLHNWLVAFSKTVN